MDDGSIGLTLQRARDMAGLDEPAAATALGVGRRQLRSIERGRRAPSHELVERAVEVYGRDLELPPRQDLVHPADPATLVVGDERIPVDLARHGNRTLLSRYLTAVRRQRGLGVKDPVAFRTADVVALAGVLDLGADDLQRELRSLAGMDDAAARRTARLLVLTGLCVVALGGASLRLSGGSGPATPTAAASSGTDVATEVVDLGPTVDVAALDGAAPDVAALDVAALDVAAAAVPASPVWSTVPTTASPFTVVARDRVDAAPVLFTTTATARSRPSATAVAERPAGLWSIGAPPVTTDDAVAAPAPPELAPGPTEA